MIFVGKKTFGELLESSEKIATNILTDRLKKLETTGIITRSKSPDSKKVNFYSLTEKGIDFLPVIAEYVLWSNKHLHNHISESARQFAAALYHDKFSVLEEMRKNLASR